MILVRFTLLVAMSSNIWTAQPQSSIQDSVTSFSSTDSLSVKNQTITEGLSKSNRDRGSWYETIEGITIILNLIGVILVTIGAYLGSRQGTKTQLLISERDRADRYKFVALDKRLQVHQEAYSHWWRIRNSLLRPYDEKRLVVIYECDRWWQENCLYLDATARKCFRALLGGAINFESLDEAKREEFKEFMRQTQKYLIEGVGVPWLDSDETKGIDEY